MSFAILEDNLDFFAMIEILELLRMFVCEEQELRRIRLATALLRLTGPIEGLKVVDMHDLKPSIILKSSLSCSAEGV